MLLRRTAHGLTLIAWLGVQYLIIAKLGHWWSRPAARWRRWLDGHGSRLLTGYIRRHGGMLIKIGQFIASRPDFFPLAYVDACGPLRDQAPARPFAEIAAALDAAYEGRVAEHLPRIEEVPLAAASFGQVHRAWLADDRLVAVKIQYPGLASSVARDLALVRLTLRLFEIALPGWPLEQIHHEIVRISREEQDYLHEGGAADRLRTGLAGKGISVPEVLWAHTREKVLVMEFADGITFAQLDVAALGEVERKRLASAIIDGFLYMLLDEGFFHADPHAGNLVYTAAADGRPAKLWLIDFGMTASITRHESELYRRFLLYVKNHDTDGMVEVLTQLGFVLPSADRAQLRALTREIYDSLAHLDPQSFKGSARQAALGTKINEFMRRMTGIAFPQHTLLLSRATSLVEGLCMVLVPGRNLLDLVRERLTGIDGIWSQLKRWRDEIGELWSSLRTLPDRLEAAAAKPRPSAPLTPLIAALLLVAAVLLEPGTPRTIAALAAGIGLLFSLRRRG